MQDDLLKQSPSVRQEPDFAQDELKDVHGIKSTFGDKITEEYIRKIRINLSIYINSTRLINQSREVSLVHTSLQRAFGWLGQTLKELGGTTPYKESENPGSTAIEPTAEWSEGTLMERWVIIDYTQTARVKDLRFVLEEMISEIKKMPPPTMVDKIDDAALFCVHEALTSLIDAKMWLGWELRSIKKKMDANEKGEKIIFTGPLPL